MCLEHGSWGLLLKGKILLSCVFIILGGSARRGLCAAPPPVGPADVPGCCGLALCLGPLRAQAARQLLPLRAPSSD